VPGQRGALDPRGKLGDASKNGHLAKVGGSGCFIFAGDQVVELLEELDGFRLGLALHHLRHHGSRRARDGAAGALEADLVNLVAVHIDIDRAAVSAQGVISLGLVIRGRNAMKVPRRLAVLENDFLIKFAQF
jgi:hypothetical protein